MARIRGRGTGPELLLGRALWSAGYRYRKHHRVYGCRPDFVFKGRMVAVFVDGCQWHGCPAHYVRPRTRDEFWGRKLAENVARDRRQTLSLESAGWTVIRIWEHAIRRDTYVAMMEVIATLTGSRPDASADFRVVSIKVIDPASDRERRHLEDLRDPSTARVDERTRTTTKS